MTRREFRLVEARRGTKPVLACTIRRSRISTALSDALRVAAILLHQSFISPELLAMHALMVVVNASADIELL